MEKSGVVDALGMFKFVRLVFGGIIVLCLIGLLFWRALWITNIENYELGFTFDKYNDGKIEIIPHQGWVMRTPIRYSVHAIDLRPYQISMSANQRILNAKLVQFNPEGLQTFVKWHGKDAGDMLYGMLEILKCYAFDKAEGKDCPFLTVLQEITPNQTGIMEVEAKK